MSLKNCKQCGNPNAKDAKTCPKCGTRLKGGIVRTLVGLFLVVFSLLLGLAILGVVLSKNPKYADKPSNQNPSGQANQVTASMPANEADFCKVVTEYADKYKQARSAGQNELRLSQLRIARRKAILAAMAQPVAQDWVGELGPLATTGEGEAYLSLKLPCGVTLKTWNNSLSDIGAGTLIAPDSPVYEKMAALREGSPVKFTGGLFQSDQDGYREASMSEVGSMEDPEFVLRFTDIEKL